jgi:hypothetical protein
MRQTPSTERMINTSTREQGTEKGSQGYGKDSLSVLVSILGGPNDRSNAVHHVPAVHACLAGCELLLVNVNVAETGQTR